MSSNLTDLPRFADALVVDIPVIVVLSLGSYLGIPHLKLGGTLLQHTLDCFLLACSNITFLKQRIFSSWKGSV